jgi:hypothetical protein
MISTFGRAAVQGYMGKSFTNVRCVQLLLPSSCIR